MRVVRKRHWLDKAEPKFWAPRNCWRVRAMQNGKPFQWILEGGRADSSATGAAIATAEWSALRAEVVEGEILHVEGSDLIDEKNAEGIALAIQRKADYADAEMADVSFDEWTEFQEWRKLKAASISVSSLGALPLLKPFKDLTAIFKAYLDARLAATRSGMKMKGDISTARHTQYVFAVAHLDRLVGSISIKPKDTFHIDAEQLAAILGKYRSASIAEMDKESFSGHWFNERMKTVRMLTTYLYQNRLLQAEPPNIEKLCEKYRIEANPQPIPVKILHALWNEADERFRGFMLLALNLGFRQTEIGAMERKNLKTIGGHVCIEKRRGKTGQPLAIPLWDSTHRFIDRFGAKSGTLFGFEDDTYKSAIDSLYHRMVKIRNRADKVIAGAKEYSFENFRDTGASFIDSVNPMLTPLYLGHGDTRMAKAYVGQIVDGTGQAVMPMQLDDALARLKNYLNLPKYQF